MQLGETIATYDVALALRGESGKFVVTSPGGETYQLTCEQDHRIVSLEWSGIGCDPRPFLIRKVAEPVPSAQPEKASTTMPETIGTSRPARAPFLVDSGDLHARAEGREAQAPPISEDPRPDASPANIVDLDLLCRPLGDDAAQPRVWVCLAAESNDRHGSLVSKGCANFNEFDAEIRRLHAQLDQIRYRARKKFYEAQIVAAGA